MPILKAMRFRCAEKRKPAKLLISGFGWSGSGALIDYAGDFANVYGFRNGFEEGSILKGMYSIGWIYRQLKKGEAVSMAEIEKVAWALRGLPGSSNIVQPFRESVNLKRNEQMRYEIGGEFVDAAVDNLITGFRKKADPHTERYDGTEKDTLKIGRRYIDELAEARIGSDRVKNPHCLIFNNDPSAYAVDLFLFHEDARYTVVSRDLRDVFADLVKLKKTTDSERDLHQFVKAQAVKLQRFKSGINALPGKIRKRLVVIEFDRFVLDIKVRKYWHEFSCLPNQRASENFRPEESRRNIGLSANLGENINAYIEEKIERERRSILAQISSVCVPI